MSLMNRSDVRIWMALSDGFFEAAKTALQKARKASRRNRVSPTAPRRIPGKDTPLWNLVATALEEELRQHGAKSRLARFLEVPPQRVTDWVRGKRRVPDAETLLRILFWLHERQALRHPSG